MLILTNTLYFVSTALLIPVIVLLLLAFIYALIMIGGFYGLYIQRLRFKQAKKRLLERIRQSDIRRMDFSGTAEHNQPFLNGIRKLAQTAWHPVHGEKIITDQELEGARELEGAKILMRIGPMLGLMGTLIPMGPALAGLAAGDIAAMATNMQIAFSTTVVGIFVGAIGFGAQMVKQRWMLEDIRDIRYVFDLALGGQ